MHILKGKEMTTKIRFLTARVSEKIRKRPEYARQLGITVEDLQSSMILKENENNPSAKKEA